MIFRPMLNWGYGTPFRELDRMRREMDRVWGAVSRDAATVCKSGVFPLVNLSEDAEAYHVRAELPGVKAADLEIQAERNTLSLKGERKIANKPENVKFHRREREAGSFSRVIRLSAEIDPEKVEANLDSGILTITVPKSEAAKSRQITVN